MFGFDSRNLNTLKMLGSPVYEVKLRHDWMPGESLASDDWLTMTG